MPSLERLNWSVSNFTQHREPAATRSHARHQRYGTDVIFCTRGDIASALISLPNRYMHSPVELVSLKDLEQIPQLLAGFVQSVKKGEQFKVKI